MSLRVVAAVAFLSAIVLLGTAVAAAEPAIFDNGYGNAQDTINTLQALGYNVVINGAAVYPLSGCKTTGVEGLRSSNVNPDGTRLDSHQFDTVYVDISCKGG